MSSVHPSPDGLPVVLELPAAANPIVAFRALSQMPHCVFLDSASTHPRRGRFSYVAADPFCFLRIHQHQHAWRLETQLAVDEQMESQQQVTETAPLAELETRLSACRSSQIEGLPAFQGGAAGLLSYDLGHSLEELPKARYNEFELPVLAMGIYDVVVAFDHQRQRAWLISQGWPETEPAARRARATMRLHAFHRRLAAEPSPPGVRTPAEMKAPSIEQASNVQPSLPELKLQGAQHRVPGHANLMSNFSADGYRTAVGKAIEYIYAGDIFQVNFAQRLIQPASSSSTVLYEALRARNPAPFAGYFDLGPEQILSASPERFLQVDGRHVETRPIKGTRRRTSQVEADLFQSSDLKQSEKDRAENVMIVDLMRNDLSRVCDAESVCVTQLCEVEPYQYVQHLVSAVTGRLQTDCSTIDLIRASFPGGSITGAPKIRAMEIIAELEPHARGAYCGSMGYLNWDGSLDLNILIRTITASHGWWQMPVGGGIVAQSDPESELQETWHKSRGLIG